MLKETGKVVTALAISCAPIVLAVIVSKPDLRQRLAMRAASYGRRFCQRQADTWQAAASRCATWYARARSC